MIQRTRAQVKPTRSRLVEHLGPSSVEVARLDDKNIYLRSQIVLRMSLGLSSKNTECLIIKRPSCAKAFRIRHL